MRWCIGQTKGFTRGYLSYFEKIGTKLIFGRFVGLDLGDGCELEIVLAVSKDDQTEEKEGKAKAKQLRNEKQCLKRMKNKDKTCQQSIDKAFFSPPTSHSGPGPVFSLIAARPSASGPFASRPSVFRSSFAFSPVSVGPFYPINLSFLGCPFHSVVFPSQIFITSKQEKNSCALFLQDDNLMEENFVSPP